MTKDPPEQSSTTYASGNSTNVVTGHKNTTNVSSPTNSTFTTNGASQTFTPPGNAQGLQQNNGTTSSIGNSNNNQNVKNGFNTPAHPANGPSGLHNTPLTLPPGHIWSQYVAALGQVLWRCEPSPTSTQQSTTSASKEDLSIVLLLLHHLGILWLIVRAGKYSPRTIDATQMV